MRAEKGSSNLALAFVAVLLLGSIAFIGISPINLDAVTPSALGNAGMSLGGGDDAEYLIITRPMFESALENLVSLKNQRMSVKVMTVEGITGTVGIPTTIDVEIGSGADPHDAQLKFDVSELEGKTVISAKLWLYVYNVHPSWQGWCYVMRVDNQTWDETMTADESNNQPTDTSESTGTVWTTDGWDYVDVATQLGNNGGADNLTVRLSHIPYGCGAQEIKNTTHLNFGLFFNSVNAYSSEAVENRPYLEVAYLPEKNYPGRDIPEQIRNCIRDHYENHGTQWVLLAGDVDPDEWKNGYINYDLDKEWEVPIRYFLENKLPTDYYYAGLDGSWDSDGDNIFGELGERDFGANVYVGRIPARDASIMQVVVKKTVAYELNPPRKIKDICFFAAPWGDPVKRGIKSDIIPSEISVHEFYELDGNLDDYSFENAINNYNPVLVNASGHGTPSEIQLAGGGNFVNTNTPTALKNKGFLMFSLSCYTNSFVSPDNCLGEAMLYGPYLSDPPYGGAVGYVGFMGETIGSGIDEAFFKEIFWNEEYHQGAILYKANEKSSSLDSLKCMLLGDPELKIVEPVLVSISPEHGSGLPGVTLTYSVTVRNMGNRGETYTLTAADEAGWNPGISPNTLTIPADENRTATLSVTVPPSTPIGAEDRITVTATSTENAEASDNASCIAHAGLRMVIYPSADVCTDTHIQGTYHRTQLKFDISGIPSGADIGSVKVWLYRYNDMGSSWDGGVTVNRVDNQTWDESIGADQFNSQPLTTQQGYVGKWMSDGWDYVSVMNQLGVDYGANNTYTSLRLRWASDDGTQPIPGCGDDTRLDIGSSYSNEPIISFRPSEHSDPAYHPYLEVIYESAWGVEVSISPHVKGGALGETIDFTITLQNTGNVEDTFDLNASDTLGWGLSISPTTPLTIPPGGQETATLSVTLAGDLSTATWSIVTVTATGTAGSASDTCVAVDGQVIFASADAYVSEAEPDTNYGSDPYLRVWSSFTPEETREEPPWWGSNRRILLKFSTENIPAGAVIKEAKLYLFCETAYTGPKNGRFDILAFPQEDTNWLEDEVTWNTQPRYWGFENWPDYPPGLIDDHSLRPIRDYPYWGPHVSDVTIDIQPQTMVGWTIKYPTAGSLPSGITTEGSGSPQGIVYWSKENPDAGILSLPHLRIIYELPS